MHSGPKPGRNWQLRYIGGVRHIVPGRFNVSTFQGLGPSPFHVPIEAFLEDGMIRVM
jgi:hypothetical protein